MEITGSEGTEVKVLPHFVPFPSLFSGPAPLYPSEAAARWAIYKMRAELVEARAVAVHRRRLYIHPERFAAIVERRAHEQFGERQPWD